MALATLPRVLGMLVAALLVSTASEASASDCLNMDKLPSVALGSSGAYALQSRVERGGSLLCLKATFMGTTSWLGVGIARSNLMVSTIGGPANVLVFDAAKMTANTYVVNGKGVAKVNMQSDQSSYTVIDMTSRDSLTSVTVSRAMSVNESHVYDVAIAVDAPTNVIWAYGAKWPGKHVDKGAMLLAFSDTKDTRNVGSTSSYVVILGTIVASMATASLALRFSFKRLDHKLVPPPREASSGCFAIQRTLSDLSVGEGILVLLYLTGLVLVLALLPFYEANIVAFDRQVSLASGHLGLFHLSLLIVPVSHVGWWLNLAQSRLLKFHKALSVVFLLCGGLHMAFSIKAYGAGIVWYRDPFGSQRVVPLFGFVALGCFLCVGVVAIPIIRLNLYELFLAIHRVLFVAGIVLVYLHSRTIQIALICPLVIYGIGGIFVRLPPFFKTYTVTTAITTSHTTMLTLPLTKHTQRWVTQYRLCSHAYVNVPAISATAWHPFTVMITPARDGIAFCIKSVKPHSFTHKLHVLSHLHDHLNVKLAGPYGQPTVDLTKYQQVVLVGGGIGVTPLLGAINFLDSHAHVKMHLCWVTMMFPLPHFVTAEFYVSLAISEGQIETNHGDVVRYSPGRPTADAILKRFQNIPRTVVLACGPKGMIMDAQREAYDRGFDFQKVVFAF
ncbi:hypothetical protein DYB36_007861 [Aphanomyces astaci]|uniref:FAD-binding FR-type domain-containing protein n=1 Tax=Aphanomyces astaci TaxID=112090 RepID=A0A397AZB9_APHAT|nr:hypothetical protein DYB36_007861 [Aphanomyces astaci]